MLSLVRYGLSQLSQVVCIALRICISSDQLALYITTTTTNSGGSWHHLPSYHHPAAAQPSNSTSAAAQPSTTQQRLSRPAVNQQSGRHFQLFHERMLYILLFFTEYENCMYSFALLLESMVNFLNSV